MSKTRVKKPKKPKTFTVESVETTLEKNLLIAQQKLEAKALEATAP